jgi:hypothetical protein
MAPADARSDRIEVLGMGIGKRIAQAFGGGPPPVGDPDATVEAGVVLLAEGPMLVQRLRDRGIDAAGLESVDPVTEVRSYMRIMVRRADVAAVHEVMAEEKAQTTGGDALDALAGEEDDEELAAAEEASQRAMGRLFVAADRLAGRPGDAGLLLEVDDVGSEVAEGPPPFGVEPLAWERIAGLAEAVVAAGDGDDDPESLIDEEAVQAAAVALRDFLRQYV